MSADAKVSNRGRARSHQGNIAQGSKASGTAAHHAVEFGRCLKGGQALSYLMFEHKVLRSFSIAVLNNKLNKPHRCG